jgi:hypothetical protein
VAPEVGGLPCAGSWRHQVVAAFAKNAGVRLRPAFWRMRLRANAATSESGSGRMRLHFRSRVRQNAGNRREGGPHSGECGYERMRLRANAAARESGYSVGFRPASTLPCRNPRPSPPTPLPRGARGDNDAERARVQSPGRRPVSSHHRMTWPNEALARRVW